MAYKESILRAVSDYCMVPQEADVYDTDLLDKINAAFFVLFQLGCSKRPFTIEDDSTTWTDFTDNPYLSPVVPEYIKKKVKLEFDPPANSFLVTQLKEEIKELESRISYTVDPGWEDLEE